MGRLGTMQALEGVVGGNCGYSKSVLEVAQKSFAILNAWSGQF